MHIAKIGVQGTGLVGMYIVPLDDVVLVGPQVSSSLDATLQKVFDAPVVRVSIAGTSLLGIFVATNGKTLIVPHIIFPHEEKILKDAGIMYHKIASHLTCHGNNIIATKKGVVANPQYDVEAITAIQEAFGLDVIPGTIAGAPTVGSFLVSNDSHGLTTHDISQEEVQQIQNHLGIALTTTTVNMGAPQIHSGVAVNNAGFVIGQQSGGPEIVTADEGLGFIDVQ